MRLISTRTAVSFVADGVERARAGLDEQVRPEVVARYASRFESAGWLTRIWLSWRIEREIARLVNQAAPSQSALF